MSWDEQAFKEKLEQTHTFPGNYIFKFIVKQAQQKEVEALFVGGEVTLKKSAKKNYLGITINKTMHSAQEVIDLYKSAYTIEGIISL